MRRCACRQGPSSDGGGEEEEEEEEGIETAVAGPLAEVEHAVGDAAEQNAGRGEEPPDVDDSIPAGEGEVLSGE